LGRQAATRCGQNYDFNRVGLIAVYELLGIPTGVGALDAIPVEQCPESIDRTSVCHAALTWHEWCNPIDGCGANSLLGESMKHDVRLSPLLSFYRLRLLASCSAVSMVLTMPALADPIINPMLTATGAINLNDGGLIQNYSQGPSAGSVDIIPFETQDSSHGFIHTYGSPSGSFGARSSGAGTYGVSSTFSYHGEVTGNQGQHAFLTFTIDNGEVLATSSATLPADAIAYARLSISISSSTAGTVAGFAAEQGNLAAGGTYFHSAGGSIALVTNEVTSSLYYDTGLGQPGEAAGYTWGSQTFEVDLGVIGASGSLSFDYVMTAVANGVRSQTSPSGGQLASGPTVVQAGDGYGYGYGFAVCNQVEAAFTFAAVEGGEGCFGQYTVELVNDAFSIARSGDPFNLHLPGNGTFANPFTANPFTDDSFSIRVADVIDTPEPATLAVLGVGAAGLLLARRRRRASSTDSGF